MGLAMNSDELEVLLNLQNGTLLSQQESPMQILSLKQREDSTKLG